MENFGKNGKFWKKLEKWKILEKIGKIKKLAKILPKKIRDHTLVDFRGCRNGVRNYEKIFRKVRENSMIIYTWCSDQIWSFFVDAGLQGLK